MPILATNGDAVNGSRAFSGETPIKVGGSRQLPSKIPPAFRDNAEAAMTCGWSPIPSRHAPAAGRPAKDAKRPVFKDWQSFGDRQMNHAELAEVYRNHPLAQINLACGFGGEVWIDTDTDNPEIIAIKERIIGRSTVARRGGKGMAEAFRVIGEPIHSQKLLSKGDDGKPGVPLIEIMGLGANVRIPPSMHPETGRAYVWLTEATVYDTLPDELPTVSAKQIAELRAALAPWLYQRPETEPSPRLKVQPADITQRQRTRYQAMADKQFSQRIADLRTTKKGGRNRLLFSTMAALGVFIRNDFLKQDDVESAALEACKHNGLLADNGEKDVLNTIADGFAKSSADILPELKERPTARAKQAKAAETVYSTTVGKPVIQIEPGKHNPITSLAEKHLINADVQFFTRGSKVVRPVVVQLADAEGRVTKSSAFVDLDEVYLRDQMCAHIDWQRYVRREKEWVSTDAPLEVAKTLLSRRGDWKFRPVSGVISTPTLRPDGSILSKPGYDEATCLVLLDSVALPAMPEKPTKADALEALRLLDGLLEEFPFVNEESRSVARSALITPVVRGAFAVAPMHVSRAPTAGTGKSYIFDTAAAIALGHTCPVMAAGRTEEETEKRLGASAIAGHPIINIDNVNGELSGDALCQLVERPIVDIRVLGASKQERIVNRFTVFATGNNIRLVGDMTRRAVMCSLDAKVERPAEREFKLNPVQMVLKNRAKYIAACLTVVRAYVIAGRPKVAGKPMNSFEGWSDNVRSALVWLGCPDPVLTIDQVRDECPEKQQLGAFIEAIKVTCGVGSDKSYTTAELITKAQEETFTTDTPRNPELHEAIMQFYRFGKVDAKSLGRWLTGSKQKIYGNLRINSFEDKKKKVQRWFVERV